MNPNQLYKITFIRKSQDDGNQGFQVFIYLVWEDCNKVVEAIKKAYDYHCAFEKDPNYFSKIEIEIIEGQLI